MNYETKDKLNKIKEICEKVPIYKNTLLSMRDAVLIINKVMPYTSDFYLPEKLKSDLFSNPMYTAISSWCDTQYGLCIDFPNEILSVASQLVPDDSILVERDYLN